MSHCLCQRDQTGVATADCWAEVKGDSKSTDKRGPSLVCSLGLSSRYKILFILPWLLWSAQYKIIFFYRTLFQFYVSSSSSNLGRQSCRAACLWMCVSGHCRVQYPEHFPDKPVCCSLPSPVWYPPPPPHCLTPSPPHPLPQPLLIVLKRASRGLPHITPPPLPPTQNHIQARFTATVLYKLCGTQGEKARQPPFAVSGNP